MHADAVQYSSSHSSKISRAQKQNHNRTYKTNKQATDEVASACKYDLFQLGGKQLPQ